MAFTRAGQKSPTPGTFRCVICNKVNHEDISSEREEFSRNGFYEREYGSSGVPAHFCFECESAHDEIMSEYDFDEEEDDE